MIFRINFTVGDTSDSFVVEGDSIDEIREKANTELEKRGGSDPWSEEL